MAGDYILVLGATGPSGICLIRELVHRRIKAIAYARTPSKLPEDVADSPFIEVYIDLGQICIINQRLRIADR